MADAKHRIIIPQHTGIEVGGPRPNHEDFMDRSELKAAGFSGLRHNSLTEDYEIWLDGKIEVVITMEQRVLNPNIINEKWEELFGVAHVATRK